MEARSRSPRWSPGIRAASALLLLTLSAGCSGDDTEPAKAPATPTTNTSSTVPGSVVDPAVLRRDVDDVFAGSTGIYDPIRAVLVVQHGRPLVRRYYGAGTRSASNVMSVTKSVIGTLVGIAVDEGLLRLDGTLAELLPTYADHMRPNVAAITVEQLLTMTSGLTPDVNVGVLPFERSRDWVADILDRGITATPGEFAYSSAGSHLLAAILTEVTGGPVLDYARTKLFDPLGIATRPAATPVLALVNNRAYDAAPFAWATDPQGVNLGYAWLKLRASDLVKLGELYLHNGSWDGSQVVPADWVEAATTNHLAMLDTSGMGYGYQWWTSEVAGHPSFRALGFAGQLIEVVPDLDLVVVVTSDIRAPYLSAAQLAETLDDTVVSSLAG